MMGVGLKGFVRLKGDDFWSDFDGQFWEGVA